VQIISPATCAIGVRNWREVMGTTGACSVSLRLTLVIRAADFVGDGVGEGIEADQLQLLHDLLHRHARVDVPLSLVPRERKETTYGRGINVREFHVRKGRLVPCHSPALIVKTSGFVGRQSLVGFPRPTQSTVESIHGLEGVFGDLDEENCLALGLAALDGWNQPEIGVPGYAVCDDLDRALAHRNACHMPVIAHTNIHSASAPRGKSRARLNNLVRLAERSFPFNGLAFGSDGRESGLWSPCCHVSSLFRIPEILP